MACLLAAGLLAAPWASAGEPLRYVALGDSSASGPVIPNQVDTTCGRSDHNWPHVLATTLGATLTDVTCSGATTANFTTGQFSNVGPQFDALRSDTDLVTVAIGANDIGGVWAFKLCPNPTDGQTCQQRLAAAGIRYDAAIAADASNVKNALEEIRRRSPHARVFVVGYLTYWKAGGCFPADPFTSTDADYLQSTFDSLMTMLANQAAAAGATYVDIRNPSADHGLCEPEAQRWLEGANPAAPAYPYHPNATGMAQAAQIIAQKINAG